MYAEFATKNNLYWKTGVFSKEWVFATCHSRKIYHQDVAMGISHTGKSRQTVDALAIAKEAGARTIAITNSETAVINRFADIVLCTENRQYMYGDAIFSRCAQVSIVDMLYLGVFLTDYEQNAKRLESELGRDSKVNLLNWLCKKYRGKTMEMRNLYVRLTFQ